MEVALHFWMTCCTSSPVMASLTKGIDGVGTLGIQVGLLKDLAVAPQVYGLEVNLCLQSGFEFTP